MCVLLSIFLRGLTVCNRYSVVLKRKTKVKIHWFGYSLNSYWYYLCARQQPGARLCLRRFLLPTLACASPMGSNPFLFLRGPSPNKLFLAAFSFAFWELQISRHSLWLYFCFYKKLKDFLCTSYNLSQSHKYGQYLLSLFLGSGSPHVLMCLEVFLY